MSIKSSLNTFEVNASNAAILTAGSTVLCSAHEQHLSSTPSTAATPLQLHQATQHPFPATSTHLAPPAISTAGHTEAFAAQFSRRPWGASHCSGCRHDSARTDVGAALSGPSPAQLHQPSFSHHLAVHLLLLCLWVAGRLLRVPSRLAWVAGLGVAGLGVARLGIPGRLRRVLVA